MEVLKLTAIMPKFRPSKVKVKLRDGSSPETEAITNKGDTEDPYSKDELRAKYFDLALLTWKREVAEDIHVEVTKLETLPDMRVLTGKMRQVGLFLLWNRRISNKSGCCRDVSSSKSCRISKRKDLGITHQ